MVLTTPITQSSKVALLNNTSIYTILRSPKFFSFLADTTKWKTCHVTIITSWRILTFKKCKAIVLLPRNLLIICREAIYVTDAPQSLISYRDLRVNQIHISTALEKDEGALELKQGRSFFVTAHAGVDDLYEIAI